MPKRLVPIFLLAASWTITAQAAGKPKEIVIESGSHTVLEVSSRPRRIAIGNPDIADAAPLESGSTRVDGRPTRKHVRSARKARLKRGTERSSSD